MFSLISKLNFCKMLFSKNKDSLIGPLRLMYVAIEDFCLSD